MGGFWPFFGPFLGVFWGFSGKSRFLADFWGFFRKSAGAAKIPKFAQNVRTRPRRRFAPGTGNSHAFISSPLNEGSSAFPGTEGRILDSIQDDGFFADFCCFLFASYDAQVANVYDVCTFFLINSYFIVFFINAVFALFIEMVFFVDFI